jgi:hypothetical protein
MGDAFLDEKWQKLRQAGQSAGWLAGVLPKISAVDLHSYLICAIFKVPKVD